MTARHPRDTKPRVETPPETAEDPKKGNGQITIKVQRRVHDLVQKIIDLEAVEMMKATGGGSCEGCIEEFKKRIPMTEIIYRAVRMLARAKGLRL